MSQTDLPPAIQRFVAAANAFDLDKWMDCFAEDAFVNDNRREFRGKAAIRRLPPRKSSVTRSRWT